MFLAFNHEDMGWIRVLILSEDRKTGSITFKLIDFGTVETMPRDEQKFRELPADVQRVPSLAVTVQLPMLTQDGVDKDEDELLSLLSKDILSACDEDHKLFLRYEYLLS